MPEKSLTTVRFCACSTVGPITGRTAWRIVIDTAREVAGLDLLSGGRVILTVGTGWNRAEMRNHGRDPRTRGRLIWADDEAEFHGDHVDFFVH
jgi:hypothetical protein